MKRLMLWLFVLVMLWCPVISYAAVVTELGTTINNTPGTHTVTATPAVGDYIVIAVWRGGLVAPVAPTDNNADGLGTYVRQVACNGNANANTSEIWVRNSLIGSGTSTVFTATDPLDPSGGGITVLKVTGITLAGIAAVMQVGGQDNQAGGGTPAPVLLSGVPETNNPIIATVMNITNPAGVTARTGYTRITNTGMAQPLGVEVIKRDSGETSATLTFGGTSASAFCTMAIELESRVITESSVFTDAFTRADSPNLGSNYTTITGADTPQIVSNTVEAASANNTQNIVVQNNVSLNSNQYAKITFNSITGAKRAFGTVITNETSSTVHTGYFVRGEINGATTTLLIKVVAGVETTLGTENATTWAATNIIKLWSYATTNLGTRLIAFRNSTPMFVGLDSSGTVTGKMPGIEIGLDVGGTLANISLDNYEVGNLNVSFPGSRIGILPMMGVGN